MISEKYCRRLRLFMVMRTGLVDYALIHVFASSPQGGWGGVCESPSYVTINKRTDHLGVYIIHFISNILQY
jgi:hypothetical protein